MRILTVCQGGACRSVALANVLKEAGHDALAVSHRYNSAPTILKLARWAERIVVMQPHMAKHVPAEHQEKVLVCDVGPDRWRNAMHDELQGICAAWAKQEGFK